MLLIVQHILYILIDTTLPLLVVQSSFI
jgi:hypothetical protein